MKYSASTLRLSGFWSQRPDVFGDRFTILGLWATKLRKAVVHALTQVQIARTQSVLNTLTDEQLKRIDLKRSDIKRHAECLATYEYDGL